MTFWAAGEVCADAWDLNSERKSKAAIQAGLGDFSISTRHMR